MHDSCIRPEGRFGVDRGWKGPGAAPTLYAVGGVALLHPEVQVFEAMLEGWQNQQRSRNLRRDTIGARRDLVCRFQRFTAEWPWQWRAVGVEDFTAHLRSGTTSLARSTIRSYHGHLRQFMDYLADPHYEWTSVCERLFGTHPVQICFDWNTAAHTQDYEGRPPRRALTKAELQQLFDYADDQVVEARASGNKGWLQAMRDSAALKTAYAWGLRRRELVMLDLADLGVNPHAPEFGRYGVVYVRWGKANKGSAPKRRSVLTVFPWSVRVLAQWIEDYRFLFTRTSAGPALWPSERSDRLDISALSDRFADYRDALGLPEELSLHCLRHSYVTHLIEDGFDPLFVQQQVGHSYASTTALYTSVSSDFRNRVLRQALDATLDRVLAGQRATT